MKSRGSFGPHDVHHFMLEAKKIALQLVDGRVHVVGQLLQRHRGVELQIRPTKSRKVLQLTGDEIFIDKSKLKRCNY